MSQVARALDRIFRAESGAVLATLIRVLGDFQLAEDALQDALEAALETWPKTGLPSSPGAWLSTTARRKALDRLRHQRIALKKGDAIETLIRLERENEGRPDTIELSPVPDDRLRLIFTCCHPALAVEAQVALTLRTIGGLSTPEIARAFLVSEATLAQRLVRAKQKISRAKIPYEIPDRESLGERLEAVLAVLYLVFNEGYFASSGRALVRGDLVVDAIRLARVLAELLPSEPETKGLLALMLLHDSRREARVGSDGELILLEDQDRALWKREAIEEGVRLVEEALEMGRPGRYQVHAAIAAVHAEAKSANETDWAQIALLYRELHKFEPTPVVELNAAVAVSYAASPDRGLAILDEIDRSGALSSYAPLFIARADLLSRLGREEEARREYERALPLAENEQVRRFIEKRLRTRDLHS
jgi:RNA polymerase sigma-70 factor, ECF subfamily